MRIDRVVARAFGPLRGEELDLAPGMTVVGGPNEAGKSTWHAALRLALTGVRRGKGPGTLIERQLADRHRPWDDPERWEVEARLELADGRRIEIRQDLAGKVDCRAVDLGLGRDVSDEILDGTPDASRWLGLNRDTFAATVSVSQAQILSVTDAADDLQEQMQRAAATQGSDSTAAEAIDRLEQFRRDAVGVDRIGARGPLRTAKDRLAALEARMADVRRLHEEYLERSAAMDGATHRVQEARRAVLRLEAELAAGRAARARARHAQAAELSRRHPEAPGAMSGRDERADRVAAAVDGWASRPEPVLLDGPTVEDLEAELAALPGSPVGDREPHPAVHEAERALDLAEAALEAHAAEPVEVPTPLPGIGEERVRELARRLEAAPLPGAANLHQELDAARAAAAGARSAVTLPAAILSAVAALGGVGLLLAGLTIPMLGAFAVAMVAAVWSWWSERGSRRAGTRVARAEAALAPYRAAQEAIDSDRAAAAREARVAGLPVAPRELEELADRIARADVVRRTAADHAARRATLAERRDAAAAALLAALQDRGQPPLDDPRTTLSAYEAACRKRAEAAVTSARREPLRRQIEARRAAERSASAAAERAATAEQRLRAAAAEVGVDPQADPEQLVATLRSWQRDQAGRLTENEAAIGEWERLQALLDGATLAELAEREAGLQRQAAELAARLGEPVAAHHAPPAELESRLASARSRLTEATSNADALAGNLAARREGLPDVAEAEEAVAAARTELQRVEGLAATLGATLDLLRSAEERVHRNLAPVLAASIVRWLPVISGGAYVEATVDPADLAVRVKEAATGKWREARLLSEGTREQIYLLLRVAMAEHLVTTGETAPLLLDEVTVQSDAERKRQLLDVLHALSAERQVVLFTHDADVIEWASGHLAADRDATVLLGPRRTGSTLAADPADSEAPPASFPVGDTAG